MAGSFRRRLPGFATSDEVILNPVAAPRAAPTGSHRSARVMHPPVASRARYESVRGVQRHEMIDAMRGLVT